MKIAVSVLKTDDHKKHNFTMGSGLTLRPLVLSQ